MKNLFEYLISKENKNKIGKAYPDHLPIMLVTSQGGKNINDEFKEVWKEFDLDIVDCGKVPHTTFEVLVTDMKSFKVICKELPRLLDWWDFFIFRNEKFDRKNIERNKERYIDTAQKCWKGWHPDGFITLQEIRNIMIDKI